MKIIVQVKLLPTPEDEAALAATLRTVNDAADWLSDLAFAWNVKTRQGLQRHAYRQVKQQFGLSAQPAPDPPWSGGWTWLGAQQPVGRPSCKLDPSASGSRS